MWDVRACAVCFSTDVKLHSLNTGNLRNEFNSISGLKTVKGSGMPNHLCVECYAYVKKFVKFRQKCKRAHYTMEQMLDVHSEIKKIHLKTLNRKQLDIMPSLSFNDLNRVHYEQHMFQWITNCRETVSQFDYIPVAHYSILTEEDTFASVMTNTCGVEIDKSEIKTEEHKDNNDITAMLGNEDVNQLKSKSENEELPEISNLLQERKYEQVDFMDDSNDADIWNDFNKGIHIDDDADVDVNDDFGVNSCILENKADGSKFNEEYAQMVPISVKEAKAAVEIKKIFMTGFYKCSGCGRAFKTEENLKLHARMHDRHEKGNYHCKICNYYYKTQFLLQTHMTEKHMYKYLCRMCPEVNFDRTSAKSHFCQKHLTQEKANGVVERPAWLSRPSKKRKPVTSVTPLSSRKRMKVPKGVLTYTPIKPEEQYSIIQERKMTRNYLEAKYKCELCFRGYRLMSTYNNHMVKHDPAISGNLQCDMCKLYFRDQRRIYKHMNMYHNNKYSCNSCDFVSTNRSQAVSHYKWHKNVTYDCMHCDKKFSKASTQLTHIRLKHPSTIICNLCGHSFVSEAGLTCHKQIAHSNDDKEENQVPYIDTTSPNYCVDCGIMFANDQAFATHLGSSSNHVKTNVSSQMLQRECRNRSFRERGVPKRGSREERQRQRQRNSSSEVLNTGVTTATNCEVCGKYLVNDVQARRHYESEHPGADYLRRYMCEICGHTARQYANLIVHMRKHTNEKPYECPHCDRRFSMLSNRDRHLVVHTGEKRFQCHHCSRRFTQSSAVKLHIQTVHLKIPYAPWDKKNRKRKKELESAGVSSDVNITEAPPLPIMPPQPQHKLVLDTQGEYINAYITYNDV